MRSIRVTLLPLTLSLLSSAAFATTVYKWVDEQGVTHYSDQPHPQAQVIEVQSVQTVRGEPAPSVSTGSTRSGANGQQYSCELYRPENDEVFLNTSTITAKLRLEPQLTNGDQIAIALDGKRVDGQPTTGSEFVLSDIPRGTHTVMVGVYDRTGKQQLCATPTITFHVRQPSVQAPVKAVRPKF
jgi:Domain of unknown function (DUF4124)